MAINFFTRKEYSGRNALVLGNGQYATFLQWKAGGYMVRKGEKGTRIVKVVRTTKKDSKGKKKEARGMRTYTVFARSQVDTLA